MIVKYSKKFAYAPYLNYDVGFEEEFNISSDDVEAVIAALKKLDFIAEKFHKENNVETQGSEGRGEFVNALELPSMDYKERDRLEQLIEKADSVEVLATYKEAASKHGAIKTYMDKLKKLTQL